jgi:DNA polymerase-3 subunit epsilon
MVCTTVPSTLSSLPQRPGVYHFYNANDHLLYVGKSICLRERVQSHFSQAKRDTKEERMMQQTTKITWEETVGELGALLLEAKQIKQLQPLYNRLLRRSRILYGIQLITSTANYYQAELVRLAQIDINSIHQFYGLSRSKKKLLTTMTEYTKEFNLCAKYMGLEKSKGPCFNHQLKRCHGACVRKEDYLAYNHRVLLALENISIKQWIFPHAIIIAESSKKTDNIAYHLIDKWCHIHTQPSLQTISHVATSVGDFDFDIYKILAKSILRPATCLQILDAKTQQPWAKHKRFPNSSNFVYNHC